MSVSDQNKHRIKGVSPCVSVIVPVYGVERYLRRCVDSLRNQTLKDIEIILVDDGSPDGCPAICDDYADRDGRIRVIHKENGGLGYARNSGLDEAKGEYISFVDADDYAELHMLEVMYRAAKQYDADIVRADHYRESADGSILNGRDVPPMREGYYGKEALRRSLLYPQLGLLPEDGGKRYVSCSVWRNIYRRTVIEEGNLRFVSERQIISEDLIFNISFMMRASSACVVNEKLYHYIVNEQSLTQTFKPDRFQKELVLYRELKAKVKEERMPESCQIRLQRHLLVRARRCIKGELYQPGPWKEKKKRLKAILSEKELKETLRTYPITKLPVKYRAVALAMKWEQLFWLKMVRSKL